MKHTMEEIMGRALWEAVEQLRQSRDPERDALAALSDDQVAELSELLCTASAVQGGLLQDASSEERRAAVRARVMAAIAERERMQRRSIWQRVRQSCAQPFTVRAWQGAVMATAVALAIFFVAAIQRPEPVPPPPSRPGFVEVPPDVTPASHSQAGNQLAALAAHQLLPTDERSVWAHLVRCDECFRHYEAILVQQAPADEDGPVQRGAASVTTLLAAR